MEGTDNAFEPLVSVVIPVYNGGDYLREAIDSALSQTYRNVEVLVINDGSDDDGETEGIARSYGNRIRYLAKPNGGVATALNLGIREMRGEYFSWLSHDDVYCPEKVRRQIDLLDELGRPADVIPYSDYAFMDEQGRESGLEVLRDVPREAFPYELLMHPKIHGCSLLIPRAAFVKRGGFAEDEPYTQDYSKWFDLQDHFRFVHQPEVLIKSRRHAKQGSRQTAFHREYASYVRRELPRFYGDGLMKMFPDARQRRTKAQNLALKLLEQVPEIVDGSVYRGLGVSPEELSPFAAADSPEDVLVICPDYPSDDNPYPCAFVHQRAREYVANGQSVRVLVPDRAFAGDNGFRYVFDDLQVTRTGIGGVRRYLDGAGPFKAIVVHFADECLLNVLERESVRTPIAVVIHGAEILCEWFSVNFARGYFADERGISGQGSDFSAKKTLFRRLAATPNFTWIFVSEAVRRDAERVLGVDFSRNCSIIPNAVDERRFVYRQRTAEDRKRLLFCRRFDDERVYCADTVMLAIRRLSEKPYFKDLTIDVYGDGDAWELLTAPARSFPNVRFFRQFLPNDALPRVLANYGIGLYPSRYDSQGVAIAEAAATGMVVIGGDIPVMREIYPQSDFGTLVDPDDPESVVTVVDRLFRDPDLFLRLSRTMGDRPRSAFCREKTVLRELELIRNLSPVNGGPKPVEQCDSPVLTVVVTRQHEEDALRSGVGAMQSGVVEVSWAEPSFLSLGHSVRQARGRYVRVVDAADWIVRLALAEQVRRLARETADCVLTDGCCDYRDSGFLRPIERSCQLPEGGRRQSEDFSFAGYGFQGGGPTLAEGTWRRDCLLRFFADKNDATLRTGWGRVRIPYRCAHSYVRYGLDVYRLCISGTESVTSRKIMGIKSLLGMSRVGKTVVHCLKNLLPYGLIRIWQRRVYGF